MKPVSVRVKGLSEMTAEELSAFMEKIRGDCQFAQQVVEREECKRVPPRPDPEQVERLNKAKAIFLRVLRG